MSTHTELFLSFDFFSVKTPKRQITPLQTLQHTHHELIFIHLTPSSGGTVTFTLTDANCFNTLLWNQTFPQFNLDTQQMCSIFDWLQFTTLTIVHTVENHGGVCRGFGAQGRWGLICCKICFCDIHTFYIFNWKTRGEKKGWNESNGSDEQNCKSRCGGYLVIRMTSVCAGPAWCKGKNESALSLPSHSDAVSWSGWLCSKRRKILIGQKSTY